MLLAAVPALLGAQQRPPVDGGITTSLGLPQVWQWTAGVSSRSLNHAADIGSPTHVRLGVHHPLGNPVVSGLTLHLEGYAGAAKGVGEGGIRTRVMAPIFRVGVGLDHDLRRERTDVAYTFVHPARRGGLFRDGSRLRFDYIPSRGNSFSLGIDIPVNRSVPTGRTRPPRDHVRLRGPWAQPAEAHLQHPASRAPMADVAEAARAIRLLAVPFLGRDAPRAGPAGVMPLPSSLRALDSALAAGHGAGGNGAGGARTIETETRRYHAAIERALAAVVDPPGTPDAERRAPRIAAQLRRLLLEEVLLPYDRLIGQNRAPDTIRGFALHAEGVFLRWLHAEGGLSGDESRRTLVVFTELLDLLERERAALARTWREPRFVWLPLQYALRPEDHDTQAELDAIVALATGEPFTDGNAVSYVMNEQFQLQLSRTIRAAEEYHVLVTHDFRGLDDVNDPDEVAFRQVVWAYLAAMTQRVREYDRTGRFPTYMILHDQWYFSLREAPLFLRLLEDPLRHEVRLPRAFRAWEDTLRAAQAELRAALAGSSLLELQRRQYGDAWLRNLIKVHINVTNRTDPTFWSWSLIPGLPIGDEMLRDHRKLVFYDISEEDPYRGEALYTGAGVGEHYTNITWEDRSLLVNGPALLGLKAAVRELLLGHGIPPARIPYALQPRPRAPDYEARIAARVARDEFRLRAMGVHNGSGYTAKHVNVAKAVVYTLMPPGSVALVPDSFWNSEFWGAALFGASLRGVRVLLIAPSQRTNSVDNFGLHVLSRELLSRLLGAGAAFAGPIASAGGLLRIGVFDTDNDITDIPEKVAGMVATFEREPWLRDLFAFAPETYRELERSRDNIAPLDMSPDDSAEFEGDLTTKIHLKANLFASREAWTLVASPAWGRMMYSFIDQRVSQVQGRLVSLGTMESSEAPLIDVGTGDVSDWHRGLPEAARERVVFYTIMGSQNQNARSMLLDAEDALVVSTWPSVLPFMDVMLLVGESHWVTTQAELDRFLPPLGPIKTFTARWARLAF